MSSIFFTYSAKFDEINEPAPEWLAKRSINPWGHVPCLRLTKVLLNPASHLALLHSLKSIQKMSLATTRASNCLADPGSGIVPIPSPFQRQSATVSIWWFQFALIFWFWYFWNFSFNLTYLLASLHGLKSMKKMGMATTRTHNCLTDPTRGIVPVPSPFKLQPATWITWWCQLALTYWSWNFWNRNY